MTRLALILAALLTASCSGSGVSHLDSHSWVSIYDPARAWNGYTLALYRSRIPILFDMNGRIVHAWPRARVTSRVRLLPDGSLLGIALGRAVLEYDWDGKLVWEHHFEDKLPHHDVVRLENGNTMVLLRSDGAETDDLVEIDRHGRIVWEWRSSEHLARQISRSSRRDKTHLNSLQELPPNPWYPLVDERFRPGNLLLSARNLNTVLVIDKKTGEVVWTFDETLDFQHEALMIGPGLPGNGNILVFNNRFQSFHTDRQTVIVEIDPIVGSVVWHYRSDGFYSALGGIQQPLPNGNIFISSSLGRRVFEIDRSGEIVWQWTPPFEPTRPARYAYDHSPQLAALKRLPQEPVRPAADDRWVDPGVYAFSRRAARTAVWIDGRKRSVLKNNNVCSRLFLPAGATVKIGYGLNRAGVRQAGRSSYAARFDMRVRVEESGHEAELFKDVVDLVDADSWRRAFVSLEPYAFQRVELCVAAEERGNAGAATEGLAYWKNPKVVAGRIEKHSDGGLLGDLTEKEIEARKQHLKALGYVQ